MEAFHTSLSKAIIFAERLTYEKTPFSNERFGIDGKAKQAPNKTPRLLRIFH
jgi:hypothetical protein